MNCINFSWVIILSVIANIFVYAGDNPKKKADNWNINLSVSSFYDNNILKYSDKYIERFKNREDAGRFHISRYDDLVMVYAAKISYSDDIIKNLKTVFSATAGHNMYSYNSVKTWSSFDFSWLQNVSKKISFNASYSHIPEFYVNHFRDDDWIIIYGYTPETFQPYSFAKNEYSLWAQYNILSSTRARFYFSFMKYYHNEHFTEYDCDNFLYGVRVFHSLTKQININAGYRYITSAAKGYDEEGETKESSDDSDASNVEHFWSAGIGFQLPKVFSLENDISLDAQYSRRLYSTNQFGELDPYHAGRYDDYYRLGLDYNVDIISNISITAFLNWVKRDSESTFEQNNEELSAEKDYSQYQLGINFNYKFNF